MTPNPLNYFSPESPKPVKYPLLKAFFSLLEILFYTSLALVFLFLSFFMGILVFLGFVHPRPIGVIYWILIVFGLLASLFAFWETIKLIPPSAQNLAQRIRQFKSTP